MSNRWQYDAIIAEFDEHLYEIVIEGGGDTERYKRYLYLDKNTPYGKAYGDILTSLKKFHKTDDDELISLRMKYAGDV